MIHSAFSALSLISKSKSFSSMASWWKYHLVNFCQCHSYLWSQPDRIHIKQLYNLFSGLSFRCTTKLFGDKESNARDQQHPIIWVVHLTISLMYKNMMDIYDFIMQMESLPISAIGDIPHPLPLQHVYLTPHLSTNLLSVWQLVDNNCTISLTYSSWESLFIS